MNCKFIWWNLPTQIKNKLGIPLPKNWSDIPKEVNLKLRTLEQTKPSCYLEQFKPKYKVTWFTLISDLEKICNILNCV